MPPSVGFNRTESVYGALKELILTQRLEPGAALIEAHLATHFGVSKTPVREALLRLSQEGLVDLEPTRGANVHRFGAQEIADLFEMRLHLEPLALGASRFDPRVLDALEQTLTEADRALEARDHAALSRLNIAFHRGLYAGAPNRLLVRWLDELSDRRRLLSVQGWRTNDRSREEGQEHRAILEAVRSGDTVLAAGRLTAHIRGFAQILEPGGVQ
jgi:DNA-binding GntR family transcriptional regulator